jgi:hypothetical protein
MSSYNRIDLSDWIIHFVHHRNKNNDPSLIFADKYGPADYPYHADCEINERFADWYARDRDYNLAENADPLSVVCKIIRDGHIRSGWSFRNNRPTVYGPRSAVCLTEMPLHALLNYAAQRKDKGNVGVYGICLLKDELFQSGARPVIYGLTEQHRETESDWPRILDQRCGIAEHEQYRYVAMNLSGKKRIDWSHEREWRWVDSNDLCNVPGLPIWLDDEPIQFSQALILVTNEGEAERILNLTKQLYDAEFSGEDTRYSKKALLNTRVIVLDDLTCGPNLEIVNTLRIDDIPAAKRISIARPKPDKAFLEKVKDAINKADEASVKAAKDYLETAIKTNGNMNFFEPFGFVSVMVFDPQSALTEALIVLDEVSVTVDGYRLKTINKIGNRSDMFCVANIAADAAVDVLQAEFPSSVFWVSTMLD